MVRLMLADWFILAAQRPYSKSTATDWCLWNCL